MQNIVEMMEYLKEVLSEKRYKHSVGVMKKAGELAKIYNVDIEKAKIVGLLHDMAKEMSFDEYKEYASNNHIELEEDDIKVVAVLHAKIGAHMCKEKFNFTEDMQNAVHYHTTGRAGMSMLEKIIYVADKIEDGRTYKGVEKLRELASEDLDKAIIQIVNFNIIKSIKQGKAIHPLSIDMRNEIIYKKVNI